MKLIRIVGYVSALLCLAIGGLLAWVFLTDEEFAKVDFFDQSLWEESADGYTATISTKRDGMVCVCGGYECPREFQSPITKLEPTHLAFEGWLRPRYTIVKDPKASEHPNWGRMLHVAQSCLERKQGQTITLHLQASKQNDWFKLSIE